MRKLIAAPVMAVALLAGAASGAMAADWPNDGQPPAPAEKKENCMKLINLPLPLDPPSKVQLQVCQDPK